LEGDLQLAGPADSNVPRRKLGQSLFDYLDEVSRFTAPLMAHGPAYEEVMDELYDHESGLPKGCW